MHWSYGSLALSHQNDTTTTKKEHNKPICIFNGIFQGSSWPQSSSYSTNQYWTRDTIFTCQVSDSKADYTHLFILISKRQKHVILVFHKYCWSNYWWIPSHIPVKLPWLFPGAPLIFNGAPGNIQGNLTGMHHMLGWSWRISCLCLLQDHTLATLSS